MNAGEVTIFDKMGSHSTKHYGLEKPECILGALEDYTNQNLPLYVKSLSVDYSDKNTEFAPLFDFNICGEESEGIQLISGLYALKTDASIKGMDLDREVTHGRLYMVVFSPYSREDTFNVMGNMGK